MYWLYAGAPMAMAAMTSSRSNDFFITISFLSLLPAGAGTPFGPWSRAAARGSRTGTNPTFRLVHDRAVALLIFVSLYEVPVDRVYDPLVVENLPVLFRLGRHPRPMHRGDV